MNLSIDALNLRLPAGWRHRAPEIARHLGQSLAEMLGDSSHDRFGEGAIDNLGPIAFEAHVSQSDRDIARHIAARCCERIRSQNGALPTGGETW